MFDIIVCDEAVAEQGYVRVITDVELMTTDFTILFSKENMLKAAREVAKKESAGIDGISGKDAYELVEAKYTEIYDEIVNGTYKPKEVLLKCIPKVDNLSKKRYIAISTVMDRMIQKILNDALKDIFDEDMVKNSYGFRKNHNCYMAVKQMVEYLECGYSVVIKLDLSDCFNHLEQNKVLYKVRQKVADVRILELINKYLKVTYVEKDKRIKSFKGSPQGSSLSPLYANLILGDLDKELVRRNHAFIRYADDICIMCKSKKAGMRILSNTTKFIEKKCKLVVNKEKCKIHCVDDGVDFLGFHIYKSSERIHIIPTQKNLERFKDKVREICIGNIDEKTILKLNPIIKGWINYYVETEISTTTKKLDLFIKKELDKAEKRSNTRIDRTKLYKCHENYRIGGHSYQKPIKNYMFPAMNGATTKSSTKEDETAASYRGRSPPAGNNMNNLILLF